MLNYIITFFVLAVLSAFLGFGGLAASFAGVAKFLTFVFVVLFIVTVLKSIATGRNIDTI